MSELNRIIAIERGIFAGIALWHIRQVREAARYLADLAEAVETCRRVAFGEDEI